MGFAAFGSCFRTVNDAAWAWCRGINAQNTGQRCSMSSYAGGAVSPTPTLDASGYAVVSYTRQCLIAGCPSVAAQFTVQPCDFPEARVKGYEPSTWGALWSAVFFVVFSAVVWSVVRRSLS